MKKALIAMSGGVDSTMAAKFMIDRGFECVGCTMSLHDYKNTENPSKSCGSTKDVDDARHAAEHLNMPFYVCDFKEEFQERVVKNFVDSYEAGKTPNPCIECNRYLKFGKLYQWAEELGCDYIVTGHYARVEQEGDRFYLKKALDDSKDQSYVLYSLTQKQLAHTMFPLGTLHKTEVREIAEQNGFDNARKADSQDICFVPNGDYAGFICRYTGRRYPHGEFVTTEGKVVGKHKGIINYTIGQRKGLGIAYSKPLYVKSILPSENKVLLCDNEELFEKEVYAERFNWISGEAPASEIRCMAKIRYRHKEQPATVYPLPDGKVKIVFDEPQRAVTPGQSAVLYQGDVVLGGGLIYLRDQ